MKQPVLFLGHGSPMNALVKNDFSKNLNLIGEKLSANKPSAILMISAHWQTHGSFYTSDETPKQIYDMSGFPDELYEVKYQPPGYPQMFAGHSDWHIKPSTGNWGLDHGTWSTLIHLFPKADVPVVQLSLDVDKNFDQHYQLAKKLSTLREQNILILGSGNIVHNLRNFSLEEKAPPMPWSLQFDHWVNENVISRNDEVILHEWSKHPQGKMAVPTTEHFLPLVYCLGASANPVGQKPQVIFDEIQNGSISMRSYWFG